MSARFGLFTDAIASLNHLILHPQEYSLESSAEHSEDTYFIEAFSQPKELLVKADKQGIHFALHID